MTAVPVGPLSPTFEDVSRVERVGDGEFRAVVSADWTVGGRPNGGYLLALLARAATTLTEHPHVIAASAHYLRPPSPGPVALTADVLRAGRSASQVRARLYQEGAQCVEALLTIGRLHENDLPHWDLGVPSIGDVAFDDATTVVTRLPHTDVTPFFDQVTIRLDPASAGFTVGRPSGRGELRGWLSLPEDEPFDPVSLLFAVDAFPPAPLDIEFTGWVPTLELTVYVRALPAPGPVRVLQRGHLIDGERVDEACFVWDRTGRLVAQGVQLAAVRMG